MPQGHKSVNSQPSGGRSRAPSNKVKAMAAEAQEKKELKAATEERAHARKDKQAKTKAKAAEHKRHQNQENIHSLDTRQWSEDDFCQPAPQDTTFSVRDVSTGIKAAPVNLSARTSKVPPARVNTTTKSVAHDGNALKTPARVLTAEKASELVCRCTQTPLVVLQARQPTALRVESIFNDAEEDDDHMQSPEPYEDPLDRLEFPESPSPDDEDYKPDRDDYVDDYEDDYEQDRDENKVSDDGVDGHDASSVPPPNGRKRVRSGSMGADDDGEYKKARKIVKSKGRPKASDYADDVQDVLDSAITHYKVDLLRFDPYPDRTHELAWAKTSWGTANRVCDLKIAHNGELVKMITCRGSHLRGEIKTKVKPLVASMYSFEEEYAFLYKTRAVGDQPKSGLYEHKIIQTTIDICFFKNRLDVGVQFNMFFRPFPCIALMLIITAIECAIDEWGTDVFEEHLHVFNDFADYCKENGCPGLVLKLLERMHDHGRIYAGADPLQKEVSRQMAPSAFAAAIAEFNERNGNFDNE
ncbi:hypothetical protein PILCRDRAFT_8323 [Piloderma croceum F 1598]|uniref:DUF6532 domain-containing protein n=1 Tax=Piloderma croceum (strain F 1598) TaxID=765440 RepID=A0A0C3BXC1_PILCF|nr:hypothetical protein PILCRDRAFT_8323 [Piloderma croceum F 1598]